MFSKKQGREKRQWQFRIVGVGVDHTFKRKRGGVAAVVFKFLHKFGMRTCACLF